MYLFPLILLLWFKKNYYKVGRFYYKVGQLLLLQTWMILLQVGQALQRGTIITKWALTWSI